jgi:hypothetical protein
MVKRKKRKKNQPKPKPSRKGQATVGQEIGSGKLRRNMQVVAIVLGMVSILGIAVFGAVYGHNKLFAIWYLFCPSAFAVVIAGCLQWQILVSPAESNNRKVVVKVTLPIVPGDASSSIFWLRNRPDTLTAIPISIFVVITNLSAVPITIDSIRAEFKEGNEGWRKLSSIPTNGQLYFVYGIPKGLKDAGTMDFRTTGIDQLLTGKQLAPNVPARGWMLFARPDGFAGIEGTSIQWRFTVEDSVGDKFQSTTEPEIIERKAKGPTDLQINNVPLVFGPSHLDISNEIKNIVVPGISN